MERDAIRRKINEGLELPLTPQEWNFLCSDPRFSEAFDSVEVEDDDIDSARKTIGALRLAFGMREEPRSLPSKDAVSGQNPGARSDMSLHATPSDRVYGAIAALQASCLPEVAAYRKRYLKDGFLSLEELPVFLREHADCIETWEDIKAGRACEGYNVEGFPASVSYEDVAYRGRAGSALHALTLLCDVLETRYGWGSDACLGLVLCGRAPLGFPRVYGVGNITPEYSGVGLRALVLRLPEYAERADLLRLFEQARAMLGHRRGAGFSERTAQAVTFAVERILQGDTIAEAALAWSNDPRQINAFRRELYRALDRVGCSLGPPAVHPRGKRRKRSTGPEG